MPHKNIPSDRGSLRRSGRNLLKLLGGKAINVPLNLIQISLAIHLLGDKGYGFLILLSNFTSIIGDFAEFQSWQTVLHYGLQPYENKDIALLQRVLRFSFLLDISSCIVALIINVLCAIYLSAYLGWPSEWHYLGIIYSFCIIFTTSATANGILRLLNRYDLIAIHGIVITFTRFLGIVFLTFIGGGIQGAVIIWMIAAFASFFIILFLAIRQLYNQNLLKGFFDRIGDGLTKDLPGIWKFSWKTNLNMTFTLAFSQITTQIIGTMLGPITAGHYNITTKIAQAIAKPMSLLQSTLYPEMLRSWQGNNPTHLYKMALRITLLTGGITTLVLIILPYVSTPLLHMLLHKDPTQEILTLLYWLAGAQLILIWGMSFEPILITTGNASGAIISRGVTTIIFLPMLILSITWWKIQGIGPATVISAVMLITLQLLFIISGQMKRSSMQRH